MEQSNNKIILKVENLHKSFKIVHALKGIDLEIKKGEIHAIVGENGAGKSTLISIISGVFQQDKGNIFFNGERKIFKNVAEAKKSGISTVYQELSLVPNLSIAENIFAERQPVFKMGLINRRKMVLESRKMLDVFNIKIDVSTRLGDLKIADRQIIEIVKAISFKTKLLILDEPTSSIDMEEREILFNLLKKLKEDGISIIYISHQLDEIFKIADRVTVLRDGIIAGTRYVSEVKEQDVIKLMTGKYLANIYGTQSLEKVGKVLKYSREIFKIEGISYKNLLKEISFKVHGGEILGICGLVGSGRSELLETIYGLRKKSTGKIAINGKEIKNSDISEMKKNGIAYICEDRKTSGLFLKMTISENLYSVNSGILTNNSFLNRRKINKFAIEAVSRFDVKTPGIDQKVINLSGGNQQKILIAMWLMHNPVVLLVDEPTRGIDVGAKAEIHSIIKSFANNGGGVVLVSSEFTELINLAHRIIVIKRGEIIKEVINENLKEENLIEYASGII